MHVGEDPVCQTGNSDVDGSDRIDLDQMHTGTKSEIRDEYERLARIQSTYCALRRRFGWNLEEADPSEGRGRVLSFRAITDGQACQNPRTLTSLDIQGIGGTYGVPHLHRAGHTVGHSGGRVGWKRSLSI